MSGVQIVYMWADGVYVKAGLEKEKAALLVVIGADVHGKKHLLAVEAGYRESTESWLGAFRGNAEWCACNGPTFFYYTLRG